MEGFKLFRWHLLHLYRGINHAGNQNHRPDIKRVNHRIRYHPRSRRILQTDEGKDKREQIPDQTSGVTQETLYRVSQPLLFLVYHVSHQHFKGLHCHIDGCIHQHKEYHAEEHGIDVVCETAGIRQHTHDQYRHQRPDKQIGNPSAETRPGAVTQRAYNGLHDNSRQRRQYPKITQTVRVSPQRGKYPAHVRTLKCISDLNPEKSETDVPQRPEAQAGFACQTVHFCHKSVYYVPAGTV